MYCCMLVLIGTAHDRQLCQVVGRSVGQSVGQSVIQSVGQYAYVLRICIMHEKIYAYVLKKIPSEHDVSVTVHFSITRNDAVFEGVAKLLRRMAMHLRLLLTDRR